MQDARKRNYWVELHYVSLIDAQQSVDRVATRVAKGGHDIPENDIRRRFDRSRANFVEAALLADRVIVYDNASIDMPYEPVLSADPARFEIDALAPDWLISSVAKVRLKTPAAGSAIWH